MGVGNELTRYLLAQLLFCMMYIRKGESTSAVRWRIGRVSEST